MEWLAGVAAGDPAAWLVACGPAADNIEASWLDARSHALVRLAAYVAAGDGSGSAAACEQSVTAALDQGVTVDEIVGVFVALLATADAEHVAAAASTVLSVLSQATVGQPAERA